MPVVVASLMLVVIVIEVLEDGVVFVNTLLVFVSITVVMLLIGVMDSVTLFEVLGDGVVFVEMMLVVLLIGVVDSVILRDVLGNGVV